MDDAIQREAELAVSKVEAWQDPKRLESDLADIREYAQRRWGEIPVVTDHRQLVGLRDAMIGEKAQRREAAAASEAAAKRKADEARRRAQEIANKKSRISQSRTDHERAAAVLDYLDGV